jgi:hypothetical protein
MKGFGKTKTAARRILLVSLLLVLAIAVIVYLKPAAIVFIFGPIPILLVAGLAAFLAFFLDIFGMRKDPDRFVDWKSEPDMDPANCSSRSQPRERYIPRKGQHKSSAIRSYRRSLTERTRISKRTRLLDR